MDGAEEKGSICTLVNIHMCLKEQEKQLCVSDLVIRQRRAEVVCVEVSSSLHVCDANGLATFDGSTTQTWIVGLPTNLPVAVGIICILHSSYRLLSTAYTHTHTQNYTIKWHRGIMHL